MAVAMGNLKTMGELATRRLPVPATASCIEVDQLFRADAGMRSIVAHDRGALHVLDREAFYQLLVGPLGYGWALHASKPVAGLLRSARPSPALPADVAAADIAVEVISAAEAVSGDLLVVWPQGGCGTVPVEAVLTELSTLYRTQLGILAASEDQLRHQAFHDSLTGLPNRAALLEHGRRALGGARRTGNRVGVLLLDLDGFKSVNDTMGHSVGDEVLVAVADRLRSIIRGGDVVARLGGDEFAVLVETSDEADAGALAARAVETLSTPVSTSMANVLAQVSAGLAMADDDDDDDDLTIDELLRQADMAMYAAKATGRNRWMPWSASLQSDALGHAATAADLHRALRDDELILCFQPFFDVQSGEIAGVEALVRWQHPDRGLVPPSDFIGVAEQSGLVAALGEWVLRAACEQAERWRRRFPASAGLVMAVNVSPIQLLQPQFPALVSRVLESTGVDPSTLELEITEGAVVRDAPAAIGTLAELKVAGVRLAIDDFGTGYSSLSHLRRFPVDTLKIDRSFIERLAQHPADVVMVENMVTLGHALNLAVTAEGVEEEEQLAHLIRIGCDRAQGFFLGHPVVAEDLEHLMDSYREPLVAAPSARR